jgi:hypothetical protein
LTVTAHPKTQPSSWWCRRSPWRDLAFCLSFANICYLRVWRELLAFRTDEYYVLKEARLPAEFLAATANVLLVAALLWSVLQLVRRSRSARLLQSAYVCLFLLLALPLNAVRQMFPSLDPLLSPVIHNLWFDLFTAVACGSVALFWRRWTARAVARLFLVLSPFVAVTFLQAFLGVARYNPAPFNDKPLAPAVAVSPQSPRVLWIVFDEWDYRLTFPDRSPSLDFPEINRFCRESVHGENAYAPDNEETLTSLPALITGKLVAEAVKGGADELWLKFAGAPGLVRWSEQPDIFGAARAMGYNTALFGWFHPYCRVINRNLTQCAYWPLATQFSNGMGSRFTEILPNQARSLFETTFKSAFGQNITTLAHRATYFQMRERALRAAVDPALSLTLVHLPIPHAPHFYNRYTGRYDLKNWTQSRYFDSVKLVDNTIGDLRHAMESTGLWDSTTVLLSADHPHREAHLIDGKADHRIPFLLKLAGSREGAVFDAPFNTVLTHDLLLAILRKDVASPPSVVEWLERRRTIGDAAPLLKGGTDLLSLP